jgi:hypothetical protein
MRSGRLGNLVPGSGVVAMSSSEEVVGEAPNTRSTVRCARRRSSFIGSRQLHDHTRHARAERGGRPLHLGRLSVREAAAGPVHRTWTDGHLNGVGTAHVRNRADPRRLVRRNVLPEGRPDRRGLPASPPSTGRGSELPWRCSARSRPSGSSSPSLRYSPVVTLKRRTVTA